MKGKANRKLKEAERLRLEGKEPEGFEALCEARKRGVEEGSVRENPPPPLSEEASPAEVAIAAQYAAKDLKHLRGEEVGPIEGWSDERKRNLIAASEEATRRSPPPPPSDDGWY